MDTHGTHVETRVYVVYSYRYSDMNAPRIDARRFERLEGGLTTVDTLPPTVIKLTYVDAPTEKDAIAYAKAMGKV